MEVEGSVGAAAMLRELIDIVIQPFVIGPGSRLYFLNFIIFIVCGAAVYWFARPKNETARGPLGYIFPRRMYLSNSSLVDFKIYVANHFVSFKAAGIRILSVTLVASVVAAGLEPVLGGFELDGQSTLALIACSILIAMANDFATYLTHRFSHENRLLWPFHKVHHSAEHLTPLTLFRKHPVYSLFGTAIQPLIAGPLIAVFVLIFNQYNVWTMLGMNVVYAVFNFAGANLRHSHIWIDFGPVLSRIFISPAMHQIHHSIDPKHYDRNYGEVFALWDWAFGTIYIPEGRETLEFGVVADHEPVRVQPHPTLKDAYIGPFREFSRELMNSPGAQSGPANPTMPAPGTVRARTA